MKTNLLKSYAWVLHILFWSVIILPDYIIGEEGHISQFPKFISKDGHFLLIFYFNYLILVPKLLNKGKIWKYSILTLLLTLVSFSIMYYALVFYYNMSDYSIESWGSNYIMNFDLTIVYIVMSIFARSYIDLRKVVKREFKLRHQKVQVELNYLKLQLNPHFLFNNLNNIYSLCVKKDDNAPLMVSSLSDMMRNYVNYSKLSKISLDKEIETINNFISFQMLKEPMSANIDVYIEGDVCDYQITPLLLINFVENAFKHSDIFHSETAFISIACVLDEAMNLEFIVENSVFEDIGNEAIGTGNTNIKRQLDLIYMDRYKLYQTNKDGCYRLELNIMAN